MKLIDKLILSNSMSQLNRSISHPPFNNEGFNKPLPHVTRHRSIRYTTKCIRFAPTVVRDSLELVSSASNLSSLENCVRTRVYTQTIEEGGVQHCSGKRVVASLWRVCGSFCGSFCPSREEPTSLGDSPLPRIRAMYDCGALW